MRSVIVVFIVVCAAAAAAQQPSPLGEDPTQFDQLIDTALVRRDAAFIEAAAADDMRFTHGAAPGGLAWNKQQLVEAARTSTALSRTVDSVQVERHGDLIETLGHIHVLAPAQPRPDYHIFFVRLYRRGPRGWQFVSHRTVREADGAPSAGAAPQPPPAAGAAAGGGRAAAPPPEGVNRPGNGVTLPRILREVKPQYTPDAMKKRIQGAVLVECVVNVDGTVGNVKVVRSLDAVYGLDDEAIKAAKQWKFAPGTRNGEPVPVMITIELAFTLGK
jgi:TonB family protein